MTPMTITSTYVKMAPNLNSLIQVLLDKASFSNYLMTFTFWLPTDTLTLICPSVKTSVFHSYLVPSSNLLSLLCLPLSLSTSHTQSPWPHPHPLHLPIMVSFSFPHFYILLIYTHLLDSYPEGHKLYNFLFWESLKFTEKLLPSCQNDTPLAPNILVCISYK